jgi:hypothetical protein
LRGLDLSAPQIEFVQANLHLFDDAIQAAYADAGAANDAFLRYISNGIVNYANEKVQEQATGVGSGVALGFGLFLAKQLRKNIKRGLVWLPRRGRVKFGGLEIRAVRDLKDVKDGTLELMAQRGFAPKINGREIQLHHLGQNPRGPLVEIPKPMHSTANKSQHPSGNKRGVGLAFEERRDFNDWRLEYWKARARDELARRQKLKR